jgi:hypothetical protein
MQTEQALKIIQQLQDVAIQKGLFANVQTVNQVSTAIATLQAALLERNEGK